MPKRKKPVEPAEISKGVRLTETSTGMFRSQSFRVDVGQAGVRDAHRVLASMFPKTPPTLASELDAIEADARQVVESAAPPRQRDHAETVLRMLESLRAAIGHAPPDFIAVKAIELGKAAMAMRLRVEHEEGVASAAAAKAGRGAALRKHSEETVTRAVAAYREALAEKPAAKRTALQRRIAKQHGIPLRTFQRYISD